MYIYTCIYIYIYIYMHIYIYIYIYIYMHIYIYACTFRNWPHMCIKHTHAYVCMYVYIYIYIHTHIYICMCMFYARVAAYEKCMHARTHARMCAGLHAYLLSMLCYNMLCAHIFYYYVFGCIEHQ